MNQDQFTTMILQKQIEDRERKEGVRFFLLGKKWQNKYSNVKNVTK